MRGPWRCAVSLALLGAAGCIRIPVDAPSWAVDPGEQESHDPALSALADEIDPGPQAPLRAAMPADLLADLDAAQAGVDPRAAAEHDLRAALLQWHESPDPALDDAALVVLARAVARAEAVAATGRVLPELQVTMIDAYAALDERAPQIRRLFSPRAPEDAARRSLLHTAAALLRRHAAHPDVHEVLAAVADASARAQDFTRAAAVRRLLVARAADGAGPALQLALAEACYRALEPACGDAALGLARAAAGPGLQAALADVAWLGGQAHAAALPADDIDARLERTRRLRALGRTREAAASYAALCKAAPDDARPRVGLAGLALLRGDPATASTELTAAGSLRHQDRDYHELAIALLWPRMADAGPAGAQARAQLQALATSYRRFEPARAGVLATLLAATAPATPASASTPSATSTSATAASATPASSDGAAALQGLARAQPQVAALVREFPDSPDVRRIAYLAAEVATVADDALETLRAPLTPGLARDASLQDQRLETWFDLAVRWDRRDELARIADAIAGLPADAPARGDLLATTLATRATLAGEPVPDAARQIFARIADDGAPQDRARALNNLAVLQAAAGEPEAALERWTAALAFDHAVQLIRVNVAGALVRYESPPRDELGSLLDALVTGAETDDLRLLALAWRCVLATRTADANDGGLERAALATAWTRRRAADPAATPPGRWNLIAGPPRVRLEYTDERLRGRDTGGLTLTAVVERVHWLIVPPPGLDGLLAPAARRSRTAG